MSGKKTDGIGFEILFIAKSITNNINEGLPPGQEVSLINMIIS
jgi:hypothetical protein